VFAVAPAPTVYDPVVVHDPEEAITVYDPGANALRSSVDAVNPLGPDHANVGAGDPFDAVKLIEPSFTLEHDWLFTIDDKLGAVQVGTPNVSWHGADCVIFPAAVVPATEQFVFTVPEAFDK